MIYKFNKIASGATLLRDVRSKNEIGVKYETLMSRNRNWLWAINNGLSFWYCSTVPRIETDNRETRRLDGVRRRFKQQVS